MNTPVTMLDTRHSDPDAEPASWDETRRVVEAAQLFWLTTVRADDRPHVTPVAGAWAGDSAYFFTGSTEQKVMNLCRNPHVILTTGCNRWDDGLDVVIEGDAVRVTDTGTLERLAAVWAAKWDGRWQFHVLGESYEHHYVEDGEEVIVPVTIYVFAVRPTRVLAFAKGDPFGHTTHRF